MSVVEIGRVERLQIQRSSLKAGERPAQYYDPAPIQAVESFQVVADGVAIAGLDGDVLDVHHARHPLTKNRTLTNSVSIGFTSHYARMRERFGTHLVDGIAGENILVQTDRDLELADIQHGLIIEGADGRRVPLTMVSVAHPCVEFSRFALDDRQADPHQVSEVLRFLGAGMRGFYALVDSESPLQVQIGDTVFVNQP